MIIRKRKQDNLGVLLFKHQDMLCIRQRAADHGMKTADAAALLDKRVNVAAGV